MTVFIDFETQSQADIRKTGAWAYAEHPSTKVLCMAVKVDGDLPYIKTDFSDYTDLKPYMKGIFEAHNAFFEQSIWHNILHKRYGWPDIPLYQWRCSAAKAAAHSLPRSLEGCGKALGLSVQKDTEGKSVMMKLARARKPSKNNKDIFWTEATAPEDFKILHQYCITDVESEYAITNHLRDLNKLEQQVWFIDQEINRRGVKLDIQTVNNVLYLAELYTEELLQEVVEVSKGQLDNVSKRAKVLEWAESKGVTLEEYTKDYIDYALDNMILPKDIRRILEIRKELSKTSVAKYKAMKQAVCSDDRIRDILMYHGASTGRWTGKLVQLQNLPRGSIKDTERAIELINDRSLTKLKEEFGNPMEVFSSCIRNMLIADEGKKFIAGDFAAIECRVLLWLAKDNKAMEQFRKGEDLYIDMAKAIYNQEDIDKNQRQLGKTAVLGCGYGMGASRFFETCKAWGIEIEESLALTAVNAYRRKYNSVVKLWKAQENAVKTAITSPGKMVWAGDIGWAYIKEEDFLYCHLPSARNLAYYKPRLQDGRITYMANNSFTRKWDRQDTYGGKLVENITQAVARDVMANAMLKVDDVGNFRYHTSNFHIVLSVHDELVLEADQDVSPNLLKTIMEQPPKWAEGLPLAVDVWEDRRYKK